MTIDSGILFVEALKTVSKSNGFGFQAKLADQAGVSRSLLNDIIKGRSYGSDSNRRKIATVLGYSGPAYEQFLDIGRRSLGVPASSESCQPEPSLEVKSYLEKARALLEGPKGDTLKTVIDSLLKD